MTRPPRDPHLDELLADAALFGLTAEERDELLRSGHAGDETYELAAAGADLATLRREPIPEDVHARLLRSFEAAPRREATRSTASRSAQAGWWAAAACLLLAAGGWWSYATKVVSPVVVERLVPVSPAPPPSPTTAPVHDASSERTALLARAPDVETLAWTPTKDPAGRGVSGDVVWSEAEQRGFMRFRGLAANDSSKIEYQLWVFDKAQEHPIDGGVFDVGASGEVTVAITAKLHVQRPTLFAVTIEKPGGVVVSKREHIVVTAASSDG